MGRQVRFYIDESTLDALIEEALVEGEIVCEGSEANTPPTISTAVPQLARCGRGLQLYLYQPRFGDLVLRTTTNGITYVDAIKSPVVELLQTVIRHEDRRISRGRLWVEMRYWDDDGNLVEKTAELGRWYAGLARWTKRRLSRIAETGEYCSPSILELVEKGYRLT